MFEDKIAQLNEAEEMNTPIPEKRTYSVAEIQEILEIGKSSAYALIRKAPFKTVKVGSTIRISKRSFDNWLDSMS